MKRNPVKHLYSAFHHSLAGFISAWRTEFAFQMEIIMGIVLIPLAFVIGQTPLHYALLISSYLLIILVEMLNTAIEAVVDRISDDWHELSKCAKDCGSAAVLIACFIAVGIWSAIIFEVLAPMSLS